MTSVLFQCYVTLRKTVEQINDRNFRNLDYELQSLHEPGEARSGCLSIFPCHRTDFPYFHGSDGYKNT